MKSLFLEGLVSALEIVKSKGINALESLIEEHQQYQIETTAIEIKPEIR